MLALEGGMSAGDNVVLELELPEHGWTGPLWAKVLVCYPKVVELAVTSGDPRDLSALAAVTDVS